MIGSNKILTVSYGTFSCTLEGFDDPFNTMKAIAEYFRDLAAEDRYFGAEPPTPDAAMLHKIAEREVQRRVEAKIQDNGILLRAEAAPVAAEPPAPASAPASAPVSDAAEVPTPASEPAARAPAPAPAQPALLPAAADGIASRLLRLRAAAAADSAAAATAAALSARAATETAYEDDVIDLAPTAEAEPADLASAFDLSAFAADEPDHASPQAPDEAIEDAAYVEAVEDDGEAIADLLLLDGADPDDLTAEAAATDAASVEAILGDLSFDDLPPPDEGEPVEPVAAGDDAPPATQDMPAGHETEDGADALADTLAALAEDQVGTETDADAGEAAGETHSAADAAFGFDDVPAELADDLPPMAEAPETVSAEIFAPDLSTDELSSAEADAEEALEDLAEAEAEVVRPVETVAEDDWTDDAGETPSEPEMAGDDIAAETDTETDAEMEAVPGATDAGGDGDDLIAKAQMARARVVKIRRVTPTERPKTLSEADLMPTEPTAPDAAADGSDDAPADAAEADVSRLMRQADSEMSGPENRRRLSAIAHLKAAVAATIAERRSGRSKPADDSLTEAYKDDLKRAVTPMRPADEAETGETTSKPPLLVLVSEQRIDRPRVASTAPIAPVPSGPRVVTPVRPRRVAAAATEEPVAEAPATEEAAEAVMETAAAETANVTTADFEQPEDLADAAHFADPRSFAEFAERLGADDLLSLLQAAAAFAMEVEEMPSFSRPQLMRQVEVHEPGAYDREEILRGFGQLLRTGNFVKKRRGQFALSETSPMLNEARKIAAAG